jgi:hypothetical protein
MPNTSLPCHDVTVRAHGAQEHTTLPSAWVRANLRVLPKRLSDPFRLMLNGRLFTPIAVDPADYNAVRLAARAE